MFRFTPLRLVAGLAAVGAILPAPALAQSWTGSAEGAGFTSGESFRAIFFACSGDGTLDLVFESPGSRLEDGTRHTVVATVDGTAFLFDTLAHRDEATGAQTLVHAAPPAALAPLIEALKAGNGVEIATPAGRYDIPLGGSGRALAALDAGCNR